MLYILLYGMDVVTMNKTLKKTLGAFKIWHKQESSEYTEWWLYADRLTNEEVLRRITKQTELLSDVEARKIAVSRPYYERIKTSPLANNYARENR